MKPNKHRLDHRPFLVPPGKKIRLKDYDPGFTAGIDDKAQAQEALLEDISLLATAQDLLWASKEYAILIIFQALDAAGKDGAIKHVMSGVNPQGVQVTSFKAPTEDELLRHFLWRPMKHWPARGEIAIFNRSYYEEVLVVRVHPELLERQVLPRHLRGGDLKEVWEHRYQIINDFEHSAVSDNVRIIKFYLNVSKKEQRKRFLERLDNPEKNWKFSIQDVRERGHWDEYQEAFEDMLNATSTEVAPWYVIPADKKWFTRACVADIITAQIEDLKVSHPKLSAKDREALKEARKQLEAEKG